MAGSWSWVVLAALAALAASGQSTPVRRARDARCVAQDNFVSLASDESCVKYYQCYSGNAYLLQCPDNTWFNEQQQICDEGIPPNGCDLVPPPIPPPEIPDVPEEPDDVDTEPEDENDNEDVDTAPEDENENEDGDTAPEDDLNEGDGNNEENVEDNDDPADIADGSEDTTVDPEEIDDAENDNENLVEEVPISEPEETDGEEQIVEPDDEQNEQEEQVGENEEESDDQEVPINDEPIEEQQPAVDPTEGSGDPDNQDFVGEEINESPADLPEEETTDANLAEGSGNENIRSFYRALFSIDDHETDGEISQSQDVDFVLDELFEANIGDESYEEPSIEPVFVIPDIKHVLA